jgi:hypothetical protein
MGGVAVIALTSHTMTQVQFPDSVSLLYNIEKVPVHLAMMDNDRIIRK